MAKENGVVFPQAKHDFAKSNGIDASFRTEGPSLTRQEFAEECDINSLMAKYEGHALGGPGGLGRHVDSPMFYADFTQLPSSLLEYHAFMDMAQGQFMMLPALVRKEFENDATQFVEFAGDPANIDRLREWGLAAPKKVEDPPLRVEVVNPPAEMSSEPAIAAPGRKP